MPRARRVALVFVALAVLPPAPTHAGWASLGALPAPQATPSGLLFQGDGVAVSLTALSPEVVRVRWAPRGAFGRDHSYAVVTRELGDPRPSVRPGATVSEVVTPALRVRVNHSPFRIAFLDAAGESLDEDDAERGMGRAGDEVRAWKRLRDDESVYGFGEKTGRLDKRGWALGGYHYTMWNSDTYAYDSSTDPMYVSVPFCMVMRKGKAHGIFLDNTYRSTFDVGREGRSLLSFGAEGGELDYYFIQGPHPKQVIARYTALTGRIPLPPRWALGYNQCRWSYYPESRVRLLASTFRERKVPADVIWLDIHYMDGYKPFTWDHQRFPDPERMIADLRTQGFRLVTIVDPHPKKEAGYRPYDEGLAGGHFVRNPDGSIFEGPVWPSGAEKDPGNSVFPDFTRPATREWWGGLYRELVDEGVAGIWNDMNEPAVWIHPADTMPLDARHDNEGLPTDHREVHNVYGMLMTRSTFEGLSRLRPDARPFVLSRASFAGGQRYAAVWPGDNTADWTSLRQSLPTLMGLGLSGFAFVGSDIGGFAGAPSAELFTRWLQAGVFYPFMRAHAELSAPDHEPWNFGPTYEALNRRAIELRYELLPQIYNVMEEASRTGVPALRPLFLEFPEDREAWSRDDEFLFGADLLVAPVLREATMDRDVYLPPGEWFDLWTGARQAGGRTIRVRTALDSLPVFVRAGAIVFRQPVVQHTGQMSGQPLSIHLYPAARSEASLYEDDGESVAFRRGEFARRTFAQRRDGGSVTIEAGAREGRYRPAPRDLVFTVVGEPAVSSVISDAQPLARVPPEALAAAAAAWTVQGGAVVVKMRDRPEAVRLTIVRQ
jgi:alpha-glucosidase